MSRKLVGCIGLGAIVVALGSTGAAGAYTLSLKIHNPRFLAAPNTLAVDAAGDMFALKSTRNAGGALSDAQAEVVEVSPQGQLLRSFSTTFRSGSNTFYIGASGLAVTPSGRQVLVIGNASTDPGLGSTHPLIAKFNGLTGKLISAITYDTRDGTFTGGIALSADGTHAFVASDDLDAVSFQLDEFTVSPLKRVRRANINGGFASALASTGRQLAIAYGPNYAAKYLYTYTTDLGFVSFANWPGGGVAYGYHGLLMGGDTHAKQIDKFHAPGPPPPESFGAGDFTGIPIIEATDAAGDAFAYDASGPLINGNPTASGTILRFKPVIDHILLHAPRRVVRAPSVRFGLDASSDATFEYRLIGPGSTAPAFRDTIQPSLTFDGLINHATYVFQVRTISSEGGVSPTVSYRFRIALPVPHATITSHPQKSSTASQATFKFKSSLMGSKFKCVLFRPGSPLAVFLPCTSPTRYKHLIPGAYKFEVEAISKYGIVQPKPTSFRFRVT
jgi:hypothetical protein